MRLNGIVVSFFVRAAAVATASCLFSTLAYAQQDYPSKPIRMIVAVAPEDFGRAMASDRVKWAKVVATADIKINR